MMVPVISDEYQMFDMALRQKYPVASQQCFESYGRSLVRTSVIVIPIVFPFSADSGRDRNDHALQELDNRIIRSASLTYQTHGQAKSNLLFPFHVQIVCNDPRKCSKYKVHNHVVI